MQSDDPTLSTIAAIFAPDKLALVSAFQKAANK